MWHLRMTGDAQNGHNWVKGRNAESPLQTFLFWHCVTRRSAPRPTHPPTLTPPPFPQPPPQPEWVPCTTQVWQSCVTGTARSRPRPYKDALAQLPVVLFRQEVEEGSFHSKSLMSYRWQWLPWRGGGWGEWGRTGNKEEQEFSGSVLLKQSKTLIERKSQRTETGELLYVDTHLV